MQRPSFLILTVIVIAHYANIGTISLYAQATTTSKASSQAASAQNTAATMATTLAVSTGSIILAKPASDLKPGKANYKILLEVGGRKIEATKVTEITDAAKNWKIIETSQSPMGSVTDEAEVVKGTLAPVKRRVNQGPMIIALDYDGNKIKGSVDSPMANTKIDKEVTGHLFADGTGTSTILATLPFAEGYKATFTNFDMMSQQATQMLVSVVGMEEVSVAAGKFMAYKVEVGFVGSDVVNSTIWVAKDGARVLKERQSIPQMNGAVVTSELQP